MKLRSFSKEEMKLHKFLEQISSDGDVAIKLYYIDEDCRCVYDGYAREITETIMFTNFMVDCYDYNENERWIWIY